MKQVLEKTNICFSHRGYILCVELVHSCYKCFPIQFETASCVHRVKPKLQWGC